MSNTVTGKVIVIGGVQQVSEKFKKRQVVLEIEDGKYTSYVDLQLSQDKCDLANGFNIGSTITAHFNFKGRKWEKDGKVSYFNSLEIWKADVVGQQAPSAQTYTQPPMTQVTDESALPF